MAQRNILQFIILGLLDQQPRTGYELTQAFDSDIGEFWSAKHSQIYPQLSKLETAQQVTHHEEVSGEKLVRKRYALTTTGKTTLENSLSADTEPVVGGGKDEFAVKLYFIQRPDDPRLVQMLTKQGAFHKQKLTHLQEQMTLKFPAGASQHDFGHYLVLDHAIRREKAYTEWLKAALTACEK